MVLKHNKVHTYLNKYDYIHTHTHYDDTSVAGVQSNSAHMSDVKHTCEQLADICNCLNTYRHSEM